MTPEQTKMIEDLMPMVRFMVHRHIRPHQYADLVSYGYEILIDAVMATDLSTIRCPKAYFGNKIYWHIIREFKSPRHCDWFPLTCAREPVVDNDPDRNILQQQRVDWIHQHLSTLNPREREVILQILAGEDVHAAPPAVRLQKHRAISKLRKALTFAQAA